MKKLSDIKIGFIGTGPLAEQALLGLIEDGAKPKILITKPDSKVGRRQDLLPPNIVHIARLYNIKVYQPLSLRKINDADVDMLLGLDLDIFIVASYGDILPDSILELPAFGTLNIHPSLLPKYRGPTPIESALALGDESFGVSIMFLDDKVDHGPILAQAQYKDFVTEPFMVAEDFERLAGDYGIRLLLDQVLLQYLEGGISAIEQEHSEATYTKKFIKSDGLVNLEKDSLEKILNTYRACTPWPGCYFLLKRGDKDIRVKISLMSSLDDQIVIEKVIPEGKNEMTYSSFKNGYLK